MIFFKYLFKKKLKIKVGAWMTDSSKLELDASNQNLRTDSYIPNSQWQLMSLNVNSIVTNDRYIFFNDPQNGVAYNSEDVSFTITLKRYSLYFIINDIFPTLILNLITLLAFAFPYQQQLQIGKGGILFLFFFD